jgi:hypothetical protein
MRLLLISILGLLAIFSSGCCRWCRTPPCPPPPPARACWECDGDADVAFVKECLKGARTSTEKSACCQRFNSVPGTDAKRDTLRSCVAECSTP